MSNKKNIIVSGMMRSGTTLLQKILNAHKNCHIGNQTLTRMFLDEKANFHDHMGIEAYHLLSHYNESKHYSLKDFTGWLELSTGTSFLESLEAQLDLAPNCILNGVKEVMIEEYFPYLIRNGFKAIIIVRDPRDVIASMSFGSQGKEYTGKQRPVLFDLRNWRKSVQLAQSLVNEKNFMLVKFEDVLYGKYEIINNIFNFLGVELLEDTKAVNVFEDSLRAWKGNSSFGKRELFDEQAVGVYKSVLPERVIQYIEATCLDEMKYIGYECVNVNVGARVNIIKNYTDPFEINRPEFNKAYSSLNMNISYEVNRVLYKKGNPLIVSDSA